MRIVKPTSACVIVMIATLTVASLTSLAKPDGCRILQATIYQWAGQPESWLAAACGKTRTGQLQKSTRDRVKLSRCGCKMLSILIPHNDILGNPYNHE